MGNILNTGTGQTLNLPEERKFFFSQAVTIALPVMLQNLIAVGLNIVDTLMIGGLGEAALAAVGSANQVYLIYSEICFGMYSGAGVFVAQFWGIKDIKTIRKVLGIDYIVGICSAILMIILIQFTAPVIISIFAKDQVVIGLGCQYIQIVKWSYVFGGISFCILFNCRAIQELTVPTVISACAIGVNTFLNWVFIYGHLGAAAMGVEGAAIATLIARILECLTLVLYIYVFKDHTLKAKINELMSFDRHMLKDVFRMAWPVLVTEVGWAICMSLMFSAYGKISYEALAVVQVAETVTCFFQCVYFGLGNATSFIIGACLGRQEEERSYYFAKLSLKITWLCNCFTTTSLILLRHIIAGFYNFSEETNALLTVVLLVWAITIIPKMLVYVQVCGIFRAGGDTRFAMRVDLLGNIVEVILAFTAVKLLHFSLPEAVIFVYSAEVIKGIIGYIRLYSKRWINTITDVSYD